MAGSRGLDQAATLGRIAGLTPRKAPGRSMAVVRGDQMQFCAPVTAAASDRLGTVL
jgi:hypothetical protein